MRLLREAMERSGAQRFLVDGFPRDMANLTSWTAEMTTLADVQFLLFLDCPTATMTERLLHRGLSSGRNDDNEESIRKRLVTYEQSTKPIIEYFRSIGKVREVSPS